MLASRSTGQFSSEAASMRSFARNRQRSSVGSWLAMALGVRRRAGHFGFGSIATYHGPFRPRNSSAPRRLDGVDVDLLHGHHRIKHTLPFIAAGRNRFGQHTRRDLPRHAPLVFAPAARALLAAIADDGVPIAVGLGLIVGGDLEREGFGVFEGRTAVEANTGDARN